MKVETLNPAFATTPFLRVLPVPQRTGATKAGKSIVVGSCSILRQSKLFRDYQRAFEATTGFPLVLRAPGSFQVPLAGSERINPFCARMTGANKTCSACLQFQEQTEVAAETTEITSQCYAGLTESLVPIRVGEQVRGYLQTGQVFLAPPDAQQFESIRPVPQRRGRGADVPNPELESVYRQTRVVTPRQYRAIIQLLVIFAEHLAAVSNQLLIRGSTMESPWTIKTRAFIAEHQEEALRLVDVARATHMSPWHFCKRFKRATGLTFTEYLARARIESVKQKLQNVHIRISEAAFAAGFQSLSQFNRVFRRVAGEAPTSYREKLPGQASPPGAVVARPQRMAVG